MAKSQSKKVGKATNGCQIYQALAELPCKKCEGTIKPGERFTRPSLGGRPVTTGPVCRACEAFEEMPVCPKCGQDNNICRNGRISDYRCCSCGKDFEKEVA